MWQREPLADAELEQLLSTAASIGLVHDFTARTLAYTGMRASELAQMQSDWVDWQSELVRIPPTADLKSRDAARTIPVKDTDAIRVMREYFKRNEDVGVSRQTIYNRIRTVAEATDLKKKVTPHVLRHTYGTMIARRGATPQYIRQTMGHADLSSANNYLQYTGVQLEEEARDLF